MNNQLTHRHWLAYVRRRLANESFIPVVLERDWRISSVTHQRRSPRRFYFGRFLKGSGSAVVYRPEIEYARCMIFLKETDYFSNPPDPVFWRTAVEETAVAVARFCRYYRFDLFFPKQGIEKVQQAGELPTSLKDRAQFVRQLVGSLIDQSANLDLWDLELAAQPIKKHSGQTCFSHTSCTWDLDLQPEQFQVVQAAWHKASLPDDLFYWSEETVCETVEAQGIWRYLIGSYQRCYSPREWAKRQKSERT